jgi:hypothetical protein
MQEGGGGRGGVLDLQRQRLTGPHVVVGAQLREPAPLEGVGHRLRGLAGGPPAARQAARGYPAASLVSARRAELYGRCRRASGRWVSANRNRRKASRKRSLEYVNAIFGSRRKLGYVGMLCRWCRAPLSLLAASVLVGAKS